MKKISSDEIKQNLCMLVCVCVYERHSVRNDIVSEEVNCHARMIQSNGVCFFFSIFSGLFPLMKKVFLWENLWKISRNFRGKVPRSSNFHANETLKPFPALPETFSAFHTLTLSRHFSIGDVMAATVRKISGVVVKCKSQIHLTRAEGALFFRCHLCMSLVYRVHTQSPNGKRKTSGAESTARLSEWGNWGERGDCKLIIKLDVERKGRKKSLRLKFD